jgi:formylglycine-generating enzyme required for sulfatase activity
MKAFELPVASALLLLALHAEPALHARPLVDIETVLVGDPGNPEMFYNKRGSVPYEFRMGKYEVTIDEYVVFLNTVASVTTNAHLVNLWHSGMETDATVAGVRRRGSGSAADPFVYSAIGNGRRPVAYISWFGAARFCNWLHNGATNGAATETGAYVLNGVTDGTYFTGVRSAGARWWIPSENEWFKAGHYDPTKSGSVPYHGFPVRISTPPGNSVGALPHQANYRHRDNGYSVTQSASYDPNRNYLTEAGSFVASASPYGTFDQAGNLWEWTDTMKNLGRIVMGGFWDAGSTDMEITRDPSAWDETFRSRYQGFRVAGFSAPRVTEAVRRPEGFSLSWSRGATNVTVQRTTSLSADHWATLSSNNATGTFLDPSTPANRAFYRLVVPD